MKKFIALTFGASTFFLACYCTVSAQTENNKPLTHALTQEDMDYAETIDNRIENIIHGNAVFSLKPEDIIASAKLNGWSEETFEQYMSRYRQERHQLAVDLMAVLTDTNSSSETQCYAAYYLGAMRASEASEILASKIALQFSNGGVVHHFHVYPNGCYPIVDDLVQIGSPATTAIIRNLAESDNSKIEELSLQAIYRIEGDKDIVQLRLQKALVAEKDAKNQARLRSAIKAFPTLGNDGSMLGNHRLLLVCRSFWLVLAQTRVCRPRTASQPDGSAKIISRCYCNRSQRCKNFATASVRVRTCSFS